MQVGEPNPQEIEPKVESLKPCIQESPGDESRMSPKPDHGETSYKGFGRLKDKIAIVTGGDSGIGKAVCVAYSREGAHIVCSYLNEHKDAENTKRLVEDAGRKCLLISGDLSDDTHCKTIVEKTVSEFGHIDILVNNAGFQRKAVKSITEMEYESVLYTFQVNIVSMFSLVRYALPHFNPGGSVINCSSIQAYQPNPEILDYAATKGAIVTFTKGLAKQLIEKGVRVNCVAPGPVWTPLIQASFPKEKQKTFGKEETPMKRPAHPVEMAGPFVFLASCEATYVNGEILGATGGMLLA
jgi:NAD(P)-dependent dehydrogenase (short-subunit alcohol dehydrogenase family)